MDARQQQEKYQDNVRQWLGQVPAWRRCSARMGLQGKLILCFMSVVAIAIGVSSMVFLSQTQQRSRELMGEQALELATALASTSEESMSGSGAQLAHDQLEQSAANLVKSRSIVFVAYFDREGTPIACKSRDAEFQPTRIDLTGDSLQSLMRVVRKETKVFGEFAQVTAPVMRTLRQEKSDANGTNISATGTRLLGYVTVGISNQYEDAKMRRIYVMVLGVGCVMSMLALPMAYIVVHRIFLPIRQLVEATRRITNGDLDAQVAMHRPDVIGDLARSFNEMVNWVKKQQEEVELANEKLSEANADLEVKIEQRTAQLETANKRLSQEISEKEDFLRAVSHDLNAPLRNISGMATMLLMKHKDKFEEDVIHRLERIKTNVDIETDLINELLELSRIKTRRQKMEPVDMEQLVWELRGMFENDLKSRNIELIVDSQLPILNAERPRIRQVFQNLIDNAIKYMGEDKFERQIHVGCQMRTTEAEFYVRDTGMGIEADEVDKVFFVFRRGKNQAVQNIAGKGVGLASVKSIVETYSGRIWVESKLGEGSAFRFTINGMYVPSCGGGTRATNSAAA